MAVLNDLVVRLGIDGKKFQSGLNNAVGQTRSFVSDVGKILSGLALYDIGKSAVMGMKDLVTQTIGLAANAEVMKAEFRVLLGDAAKGVAFFDDLEKFSARTSFNLESSADAARQLMAAGVKQGDLLDTMQLLGDLSLGDANKLGFLSKAFTDVFNKGRLQGQELKQFAENGVGLVGALSTMLNKPAGEILKMSEAGQISFNDMKKALQGLTAEGGRFHGAMAERNQTLLGQWDSMIEAIQKTGRAIGDQLLPKIKEIVSGINAVLQKFNELPDKITFIKDLLSASFDVAFFTIKEKWSDMLKDMLAMSVREFKKINDVVFAPVNPFAAARVAGRVAGGLEGAGPQADNLGQAQRRLDELINKLRPEAPVAQMPFVGPRQNQADDGNKLRELVGNIWDKVAPIADQAKFAADGVFDRMKIKFGAVAQFFERLFTGTPAEKARQPETKLAGAMQRGSEEAYSTLVNAMMRTKDPVVRATEKASQAVVKAIKQKKEIKLGYLEAFEGVARA